MVVFAKQAQAIGPGYRRGVRGPHRHLFVGDIPLLVFLLLGFLIFLRQVSSGVQHRVEFEGFQRLVDIANSLIIAFLL